jgi:hypothetical protein
LRVAAQEEQLVTQMDQAVVVQVEFLLELSRQELLHIR